MLHLSRARLAATGGIRLFSVHATACSTFPRFEGACKVLSSGHESLQTQVHFHTEESLPSSSLSPAFAADLKESKLLVQHSSSSQRLIHVLAGKDKITPASMRKATSQAVNYLRSLKVQSAAFHVPQDKGALPVPCEEIMLHSALLTNYTYPKYQTEHKATPLESLAIVKPDGHAYTNSEVHAMCNATILARDLANERADIANPEMLAAVAKQVADRYSQGYSVLVGEELTQHGLNLHYAVGQASQFAPRLVTIEHRGNPASDDVTMIVGKGITFDTGGLNLKPTGSMESMHYDMSGAAATLATMQALGALGVKKNVVGVLGLAENAIGKGAYKPMSIIKSHKGLTVEVGNTDAEGRLVLADALSYGANKFKPKTVIDVATLTGACMVALGPYAAGLFANNDALAASLLAAGDRHFERTWRLPILPEHEEELKGKLADVSSTGESRYGGASTAAAFLKKFIDEKTHWAHLDIAGPADYTKARDHMPYGGTGFGVQLLTRYVIDHAN